MQSEPYTGGTICGMKVDLINDVTMTPDKSTWPGGLPLNDVLYGLDVISRVTSIGTSFLLFLCGCNDVAVVVKKVKGGWRKT